MLNAFLKGSVVGLETCRRLEQGRFFAAKLSPVGRLGPEQQDTIRGVTMRCGAMRAESRRIRIRYLLRYALIGHIIQTRDGEVFGFQHERRPFDCATAFRQADLWYNPAMSTVSYLDRFLEPVTDAFTPELARQLVDLRADEELQAEVAVLRRKAEQGTLSDDEEAAYKDFVEAVDVISIIQSKARRFLAQH